MITIEYLKDYMIEKIHKGRLKVGYLIVGFLFLSKSTSIHAVVDPIIHPIVYFVDLGLQVRRIKVQGRILSYIVEFSVEHPNNLRALIAHDCFELLIP